MSTIFVLSLESDNAEIDVSAQRKLSLLALPKVIWLLELAAEV